MQKNLLYIFLSVFIFSSSATFAQQDAQLSQYMFNPLYINPAAAGMDGVTRFQLHYRNQWSDYQTTFDGSGSLGTQIFAASMPLNGLHSGIGIQFVNDKTPSGAGYQNMLLSYSYQIGLSNGGVVSIGAKGGFHTKSFDSRFRPRDTGDPIVDALSGSINQMKADFSVGAIYKTVNYQIGASLNHVNTPKYSFGTDNSGQYAIKQVLNLTASYDYYLNDDIKVSPMALWKTDFTTNVLEGGAIFTYADKYWLGGSYRLNDAGIIIAGISMLKDNALRFGYSLDLTTVGATAKAPLTHEILLSYAIPAPRLLAGKKTPVRTPRFRR
ncbi:type IX secretion system membrane protein PorP/SprF [Arcicella sp. LKC2W]|uniref:PorP/SprF family type IX secretion system membrane protein n=1 Tax=Arcicella sp. LKC2W TaxID=2984198 RepID=UPI002B20A4C2|nr:type IX secretion system membrane protein PorP/SprF [Arcicella sp. LKC2W]MEA5460135.1 type IX secretion system membrane protein PorP/SprF [Arcicella sp. LKC2W]